MLKNFFDIFFTKAELEHFLKSENISSGTKFNNGKYYKNLPHF